MNPDKSEWRLGQNKLNQSVSLVRENGLWALEAVEDEDEFTGFVGGLEDRAMQKLLAVLSSYFADKIPEAEVKAYVTGAEHADFIAAMRAACEEE